jgi:hypothetical protein
MDEEIEARRLRKKGVESQSTTVDDDDQENSDKNIVSKLEEAAAGVSKPRVLMADLAND